MLGVARLLRLTGAVLEHFSMFMDLGSGSSTVVAHLLMSLLVVLLELLQTLLLSRDKILFETEHLVAVVVLTLLSLLALVLRLIARLNQPVGDRDAGLNGRAGRRNLVHLVEAGAFTDRVGAEALGRLRGLMQMVLSLRAAKAIYLFGGSCRIVIIDIAAILAAKNGGFSFADAALRAHQMQVATAVLFVA